MNHGGGSSRDRSSGQRFRQMARKTQDASLDQSIGDVDDPGALFLKDLAELYHFPNKPRPRVSSAYPYPKNVKVEELVPKNLQVNLSNYDEWKQQMLDKVIQSNGLIGFIDGTVKAPPETVVISNAQTDGGDTIYLKTENKEYVAWKRSDELVRKWILNRLSKNIKKNKKNKLEQFETAKELWEALHQLVEDLKLAEQKKRVKYDYLPLYKAAIEGNWADADKFLGKKPDAVRALITFDLETALIVAVKVVKRNAFVKKLVEMMSLEDLAIGDCNGRTALHRAAGAGNIEVAELLVKKNSGLLNLKTTENNMPLYYAAARGNKEMIRWLMDKMETEQLEDEPGFKILYLLTIKKHYDIALEVLEKNPTLASFIPENEDLKHPLSALAGNPSSFPSGNKYNFLQGFIYSSMEMELQTKKNDGMDQSKDIAEDDSRQQDIEASPTRDNSGAANNGSRDIEASPASDSSGAGNGERTYSIIMRHADNTRPKFKESLIHFRSYARLVCTVKDFNDAGPLVNPIQEKKALHDQALKLLRELCKKAIKSESDFANADRIFRVPLEQATSVGIREIVEEILEQYPYAVSFENQKKQSIFHQAIVFRREKVFNLIPQLQEYAGIVLSKLDTDKNNALHLAGDVADSQVYLSAGAAFQMQRELRWFKKVEGLVPSKSKEERNAKNKTPAEVFSDTHKELVKEGERWMKDTASSCTIIASLIATVVFAAAITVPGGSDDNGRPIFHQQSAFITFSICNGLALFSSITSVIMFLSILTSSYAEDDFLFALPNKLIIGLISLFLSILFTMAAFGATLFLVFGENKGWIQIPVVVLGGLPVILFGALQFPLLKRMFKSTYCSGIFGKQSDRMLI